MEYIKRIKKSLVFHFSLIALSYFVKFVGSGLTFMKFIIYLKKKSRKQAFFNLKLRFLINTLQIPYITSFYVF